MRQQGWTIIVKDDRDFYKHETQSNLFDSKIYKLYSDNGTFILYNKYTHTVVTIEQAINESKSWMENFRIYG